MLDTSAPDGEVKGAYPSCELSESGAVTRRSKIQYVLRPHGVTAAGITDIVSGDATSTCCCRQSVVALPTFNDGTHGHSGRFTITELSANQNSRRSRDPFCPHGGGGAGQLDRAPDRA